MSFNSKSRLRLTVEELEGRLLADAKLPVMPAALSNFAVVRTGVTPVPQVLIDPVTAAPSKAAALTTAASAGYKYTAFTIVNNSSVSVNYSIEWGNGGWKSYTLAPIRVAPTTSPP
jgi:hypothetical protein